MATTGLNITEAFNALDRSSLNFETKIRDYIAGIDPEAGMTSLEMLNLQKMMQDWTLATNLESNTIKTIGDGIKATISNIR